MLNNLFLFVVFLVSVFFGQHIQLTSEGGPYGGKIGGLVIDSAGKLYAGAYSDGNEKEGIFASTNKGVSWQKSNTPYSEFAVYDLFLSSKNELWAGTFYSGMINRSTDGGLTWVTKSTGYAPTACWAITETRTGTLLAGTAGVSYLYRSENNGDSWTFCANKRAFSFAVTKTNRIYVGGPDGLAFSDDDGVSWHLDSLFMDKEVASLAVDSLNNIYVGTGYWILGPGVYVSYDSGRTWLNKGLAVEQILALKVHSSGDIYAGTNSGALYKSTNQGNSWLRLNPENFTFGIFRIAFSGTNEIYIGSENEGVFRSTDGGRSFIPIGLPLTDIRSMVPVGDSLIASATTLGIQIYNVYTKQWEIELFNDAVSVVTDRVGNIYAALLNNTLLCSSNYGLTWSDIPLPADSGRAVLGLVCLGKDTLVLLKGSTIYRTFNRGLNWHKNTQSFQYTAIKGAGKFCIAKAGQGNNQLLYCSTDFGNTFFSTGIGTVPGNYVGVSSTETGVLYHLRYPENMLIRSTNAGISWTPVTRLSGECIYASDAGQLIISNQDTMYISFDSGNTFNAHILGNDFYYGLKDVIKNENGKFYAAVRRLGLYSFSLINDLEVTVPISQEYFLDHNYPNPFNPTTTIRYQIPLAGMVNLTVYDILGKEVAVLVNKEQPHGKYEVKFDASRLASGVYMYKLSAGGYTEVKILNVLK